MTIAFRPLLAVFLVVLCSGNAEAKKKPAAPPAVMACVDFYGHNNTVWLQAHPLPTGSDSYSRWDELNALAARQTRELLSDTQNTNSGTASTLLATLIASGLNEASQETASQQVLQPMFDAINGIRKSTDVARVVAQLNAQGVPILFDLTVLRDADTGQPRATLQPTGLGLVDPEFYTSADPQVQRVTAIYRTYLTELLKLSGVPSDKLTEQTAWAMAMEAELAKAMEKNNRKILTPAQTIKTYPQLALANYLQTQGIAPAQITLEQPAYFKAADRMIGKTAIGQWQAYLRAQVLHHLAPSLGQHYRLVHSQMFDMALRGGNAPKSTTEQVTALISEEASDLLNAAYAERYLGKTEEQKADAISEAVRTAMGRAIDRASWLSAEGKLAAQSKLAALRLAVGKPVVPMSFEGLRFDRGHYATNLLLLRRWQHAQALEILARPNWPWLVDQTQPLIGYEPSENQLIVTAAALQAPVFEGQSNAADYGSLGALIGQQMSLAFTQFTGDDGRAWKEHTAGVIAQYDAYSLAGATKIDGSKTQTLNTADLAGVELAWEAFNAQGVPDTVAKKAFFSAWASLWARQDRDAALIAASATSPYAPGKWRTNGPLSNLPSFQTTYACKAGQTMFKPENDQIAIWR